MDRLASFCAVASAGSIVGVTKGDPARQALISRQIRELESFFGVELVRRKGRGLELTEQGRELAAVGRENFKGLADYISLCRGMPWCVKIVASNSVCQWLVLPRLKEIVRSSSCVRFEIFHEQTRDMATMTREGVYDLAFLRKEAIIPGMKSKVLGEVSYSLFVPKSLLKTAPSNLSKAIHSIGIALPVGGHLRESMEQLAKKTGGSLQVPFACTSYLQAFQLLQTELCAAVLPDLAAGALDTGRFHRIAVPEKYTLCLAWSARNADIRPALTRLIEKCWEHYAISPTRMAKK